jgi:hypothetical protein
VPRGRELARSIASDASELVRSHRPLQIQWFLIYNNSVLVPNCLKNSLPP